MKNEIDKLNKRFEKELIEEFSLNQSEIHELGKLLLTNIQEQYDGLIVDSDHCWKLEEDLNFLKKLLIIVVRLQNGKKLKGEIKCGQITKKKR